MYCRFVYFLSHLHLYRAMKYMRLQNVCLSCEVSDILHVRACCFNIDHILLTRVGAATYLSQDSDLGMQMKRSTKNHNGSITAWEKHKLELCELFSALLVLWCTILSLWCLLFLEKLRIVFFHK